MTFDPNTKNLLCHSYRQFSKSPAPPRVMFPFKSVAETYCERIDDDVVPTVLWEVDYVQVPEVRQVGWSVKPTGDLI